jgi:hypothetical protein
MDPVRFTVEPGHVMTFARVVGARDLAEVPPPPGTPVPATFAAVDVQFDPAHMRNMRPAGALAAAEGAAGSVLHAEQHFEYLRPLRVGDVLTVGQAEGRTWEKPRRHGGRLKFREFIKEYRDSGDELVVRSRMVLVETEQAQG